MLDRRTVNVVRPREGHERVDVEQGDHALSSSARRTISDVSGLAIGETVNTGKLPLRRDRGRGARLRRTSREMISPTPLPSARARLLGGLIHVIVDLQRRSHGLSVGGSML
jgi:hypothetical protein